MKIYNKDIKILDIEIKKLINKIVNNRNKQINKMETKDRKDVTLENIHLVKKVKKSFKSRKNDGIYW